MDGLTSSNKSDRPRWHQEVGFENPAVRDDRQNRQSRVGALADPCLQRRYPAVNGCPQLVTALPVDILEPGLDLGNVGLGAGDTLRRRDRQLPQFILQLGPLRVFAEM